MPKRNGNPTRRVYAPEFRAQLIELVRAGRTPEELSREFEPSAQTIRNWVVQAERDRGARTDGLTSAEQAELRKLRRENRQLKLERDILFKSGGLVRPGDRHDPESYERVFGFVRDHQAVFPVATMCRLCRVSPSGYYAWRERGLSPRAVRDVVLTAQITASHARSAGTYGAPRIHVDLRDAGELVGRKRVARLMRHAGLTGVSRRRGVRTTRRGPEEMAAADLVRRDFTARGPDQLWVADITYVPTWTGFLYLAVVLDIFSRRIVGWAMATHLRTELVLAALEMARVQRRPHGVIHHSDHGSQYTSLAFGQRCEALGVRPSRGTVGDCYDNALCESFFATLECELLDRQSFPSQAEARMAIFRFIEGWYNPHRRHSALGQLSPIDYERLTSSTHEAA
ncbi:MAG: IS3 family transposase [Gemmatimonadota bacterium]|nr:IS3 family transposase [Gemmatimonadota bacterium]